MTNRLFLLELHKKVRNCFSSEGAIEIPAYPLAIPRAWYHPDYLLFLLNGTTDSFFSFQTLDSNPAKSFSLKKYSSIPGLIWMTKSTEEQLYTKLTDFFNNLQSILGFEQKDLVFKLSVKADFSYQLKEKGCSWKVQLNGADCGTAHILSEVLSTPLAKPALILCLDLPQTLLSISPSLDCDKIFWHEQYEYFSFASSFSFANIITGVEHSTIKEYFESALASDNPVVSLNLVLKSFILYYSQVLSSTFLHNLAVDSFAKIIESIKELKTKDSTVQ